jgi:hypothetical protein
MTGAPRSEPDTAFAEHYERLATAWADHEDLRRSGASIADLSRSSLALDQARNAMWGWWGENRIQGVR